MLADFLGFIEANHLVKHGDKILLAVSGGIDSMVMAHLFRHLPNETAVAHCNFSLRGSESDQDEELVMKFAQSRNIPFYSIKFDTLYYAKENGISTQMAARDLRYTWFEKIMSEKKYSSVSIAHNLDDKIETMIINLIRGTGTTGMAGIRPVTGRTIRPLLFASRERITAYCAHNGIEYREDRSNLETKYIRNKIRHLIIPVMKEINPSVLATLDETAERFADSDKIIADYITSLRTGITEERNGSTIFDLRGLKVHLKNRTVLFELFSPYGINSMQLRDLENIIEGRTGSQIYTDTYRIVRNRNELIVSEIGSSGSFCQVIASLDELAGLPFEMKAEYMSIDDSFRPPSNPFYACLDAEIASFPMTLRSWRAGDYFFPLGMDGKKKLSDYFTDRKYSLPEKEKKLVLESGGRIMWIVGDRIDERFKITPYTTRAIILKVPGMQ